MAINPIKWKECDNIHIHPCYIRMEDMIVITYEVYQIMMNYLHVYLAIYIYTYTLYMINRTLLIIHYTSTYTLHIHIHLHIHLHIHNLIYMLYICIPNIHYIIYINIHHPFPPYICEVEVTPAAGAVCPSAGEPYAPGPCATGRQENAGKLMGR